MRPILEVNLDTIIDNLVDVDELEKYNNEITSELIQEILLFIKGGLRSKVQSEKFENLEKCFDTSSSSKDVSKKEKTEKSKQEVIQSGRIPENQFVLIIGEYNGRFITAEEAQLLLND